MKTLETKIKMIGLDLDGTLLNKEKQITERTKRAIEDAIEAGVIVLPATGRPIAGIPAELLNIKGIRYAVSANGAVIYDLDKKEKIYDDCMSCQEAREILSRFDGLNIMRDVFIDGMGYVPRELFEYYMETAPSGALKDYFIQTRKPVDNFMDFILKTERKIEKISINFRYMENGELEGKKEVQKIMEEYDDFVAVPGIPTDLEITKKTATKGNALIALGKLLGIKREEIMACGDGGNDKEMIKAAGVGVAMENGEEEVKEAADFVTKSNEEDGVAFAIEQFILKRTRKANINDEDK